MKMMKFKEYLQSYADDSIEQVMDGEWIQNQGQHGKPQIIMIIH